MRGGGVNRFISKRKKQDGRDLKKMLQQVFKSGVRGGMSGLRGSRSLSDPKTNADF